jgi:hypothetical protein
VREKKKKKTIRDIVEQFSSHQNRRASYKKKIQSNKKMSMNAYRPMPSNTLPSYGRYNPYASASFTEGASDHVGGGIYGSTGALADLSSPYDSSYLNALKNINNRQLNQLNTSLPVSSYSSSNYIRNPYAPGSTIGSHPTSYLPSYQPFNTEPSRPMDDLDMEFARMEAATNPNQQAKGSLANRSGDEQLPSDRMVNKVKRASHAPAAAGGGEFMQNMPAAQSQDTMPQQRPRPQQPVAAAAAAPSTNEEMNVYTNFAGRLAKNPANMNQPRTADQEALDQILAPRMKQGPNGVKGNNRPMMAPPPKGGGYSQNPQMSHINDDRPTNRALRNAAPVMFVAPVG